MEAGQSIKAIEAALECRQWQKAAAIVEALDSSSAGPFYKRIARHYENARAYEEAERYYVRARLPGEAVEMYTRVDKWEQAHKVAVTHMTDKEAAVLYTKRRVRAPAPLPPAAGVKGRRSCGWRRCLRRRLHE